jgi:hypothetical protein
MKQEIPFVQSGLQKRSANMDASVVTTIQKTIMAAKSFRRFTHASYQPQEGNGARKHPEPQMHADTTTFPTIGRARIEVEEFSPHPFSLFPNTWRG